MQARKDDGIHSQHEVRDKIRVKSGKMADTEIEKQKLGQKVGKVNNVTKTKTAAKFYKKLKANSYKSRQEILPSRKR